MPVNDGKKDEKQQSKSKFSPSDIKDISKSYRSGWAYAEFAFQYGIAIILCTLIGYWLDNWLGTGNILMIAGVIIGSVAGFIGLLKSLKVINFKKTDVGNKKN